MTVNLDNTYLRVNGTLNARGTVDERISLINNGTFVPGLINPAVQFTSACIPWSEQTQSGTILENAIVSSSQNDHTISIV